MSSYNRCVCTKDKSTYWPPNHITTNDTNLLGNSDQFCISFFHIMTCWELDVKSHICLNKDSFKCRHKNITLLVRVQNSERETLKVVRYTNCIMSNRRPKHSEEFMITDDSILIPNSTITIYTQLQPCHHSGGRDGTYDERSCTELVINWNNSKLKPLNIKLKFQCGNIYKAMWNMTDKEFEKINKNKNNNIYKSSAQNARVGIQLINREGIEMTMIDKDGWNFLLTHTKNCNISKELWDKKYEVNKKLNTLIKSLI